MNPAARRRTALAAARGFARAANTAAVPTRPYYREASMEDSAVFRENMEQYKYLQKLVGRPQKQVQLFEDFKDTAPSFVWNYMTKQLAHHPNAEELLKQHMVDFERLSQPNAESFNELLRAYGRLYNGKMLEKTFLKMIDYGFQPCLRTAHALLLGFIQAGSADRMMYYFHRLKRDFNIYYTAHTFNIVLRRFSKDGKGDMALHVLQMFKESGLDLNSRSYNTVLDALSRSPELHRPTLEIMYELADEMTEGGHAMDSFSYTAFVAYYARRNDMEGVKKWHERATKSGAPITVHLANALMMFYGTRGETDAVLRVYAEMQRHGVQANSHVLNSMMRAFGQAGKIKEMTQLFTTVTDPDSNIPIELNAHIFNSMMGGFAAKDEIGLMEMCFTEMKQRGVAPNQYIFITMLTAMAKRKDIKRMRQLFNEMREEHGLTPNVIVFGTMMRGYANTKQTATIFELYKQMKDLKVVPNTRIYSLLLSQLATYRPSNDDWNAPGTLKGLRGAGLLKRMTEIKTEMEKYGVEPNKYTYNALVSGASRHGNTELASDYFDEAIKLGIKPDTAMYNSLLASFVRTRKGAINTAKMEDILDTMVREESKGVQPNVAVYTTMITAYSHSDDVDKMLECYDEMKKQGIRPTLHTFNTIVQKLAKEGDTSLMLHYLGELNHYKIQPDILTVNAISLLLSSLQTRRRAREEAQRKQSLASGDLSEDERMLLMGFDDQTHDDDDERVMHDISIVDQLVDGLDKRSLRPHDRFPGTKPKRNKPGNATRQQRPRRAKSAASTSSAQSSHDPYRR